MSDGLTRSHGERKPSRAVPAVAAIIAAALMLVSVALLNRSPLAYPDTRAYWMGGKTGLARVETLINRFQVGQNRPTEPGALAKDREDNAIKAAVGVRSVFYSLFVYLSERAGTFWGTIFLQGLFCAFLSYLFYRCALGAPSARVYVFGVAILCAVTSLPWLSSQLMPDVFTGFIIANTILLSRYAQRLSKAEITAVVVLQSFAVSTHSSHLLIALAMIGVCVALSLFAREQRQTIGPMLLCLGTPVVLVVALTLLASWIGFGQLSLTPQAPPFLLARSLEDGPARWFLENSCPDSGFRMCRYVDKLPRDANGFLWDGDGIYMTADPDTRAQIRKEEVPLVVAAIRAYPAGQVKASVRNILRQFSEFGTGDFILGRAVEIEDGEFRWHQSAYGDATSVTAFFSAIHVGAVVLSTAILGIAFIFGKPIRMTRHVIILLVAGLAANAVVCGVFSGPFPRYQSRVIWLLPAISLMAVYGARTPIGARELRQLDGAAADEGSTTR